MGQRSPIGAPAAERELQSYRTGVVAMRRVVLLLVPLLVVLVVTGLATPALAGHGYPYHNHHGVSVSVGFGFGWPYYGYGYGYGYGWPYYGWPYGYGPYYGWPYGGYAAAARPVYVQAGDGDKKDLPATVETKIKPRKAQVVVDGEAVGKANDFDGDWNILFLEPGRHVIEFSAPELMTFRTVIEARAGSHYRIQEQMKKGEGLDPRSSTEPAPEPRAEARPAASAPEPRPTRPSAPTDESAGMRNGFLWLRVRPADAAVYLDGKFLGNADELSRLHGGIPVALGRHKVEVLMPGHETVSRTVTVEDDEPVELTIDLAREDR